MTKKQARKKKYQHGKNNSFCPNCRTFAKLTRFGVCIRCSPISEKVNDSINNGIDFIRAIGIAGLKNELKSPKVLDSE